MGRFRGGDQGHTKGGSGVVLRRRDGRPILEWQDWEPPKENYHWKAGRSAMELARAWFTSPTPVIPKEFRELLNSHSLTQGILIEEGYPEFVTPLPERGEGRNHDLVLKGKMGKIRTTICVEAKVDEPFGNQTVEDYWNAAKKKRESPDSRPSRAPERISALLKLVFGFDAHPNCPPWGNIGYQLLSAIAGTILQAIQDDSFFAIFVVHEFQTLEMNSEQAEKNQSDYAHAVRTIIGSTNFDVEPGKLYGPIRINPKPIREKDVELFVGKCLCRWRYPGRT